MLRKIIFEITAEEIWQIEHTNPAFVVGMFNIDISSVASEVAINSLVMSHMQDICSKYQLDFEIHVQTEKDTISICIDETSEQSQLFSYVVLLNNEMMLFKDEVLIPYLYAALRDQPNDEVMKNIQKTTALSYEEIYHELCIISAIKGA